MGNKVLRYAEFARLMNIESFVKRFEIVDGLDRSSLSLFERLMSMNVATFLSTGGAFVLNKAQVAEVEKLRESKLSSGSDQSGFLLDVFYEPNKKDQCIDMNIVIPGGVTASSLILRQQDASPFLRVVGAYLDGVRYSLEDFEITFETTDLSEARAELHKIVSYLQSSHPDVSGRNDVVIVEADFEAEESGRESSMLADFERRLIAATAHSDSSVVKKKPTLH